ncbi:MAG: hypothetical protein A2V21_313060 [Deltaproteobacteria bacterium GWC2_55_46]|nr:MAG: hypothetical protein A2Z79_07245 [Deltaproteobacteria bacterium GWA2_55_82]OGQ64381.1 MAG: hypothetical protein A3I81_00195 [Deltaproteobacteria bacterium RIFCSPLOWO2_02_FULL_55_12]OIJ72562.1 MAG: hypothetical protein A2V21_313060 [Deltaproteobacteria bacterium GWC2_55_46]
MTRDPFYKKIIEGLNGQLDPELFEQCAADLLRAEWPTLVPIRGGADAGMDGAVADGKGRPFPLVSTTSVDVIGNLTSNLETYISKGGPRREAILATSQALSGQKRKNLEERATELGFTLIQIYDQAALADRLYHNSHWCRELLNLTGEPPALSVVPVSFRPLIGDALIGRDADLSWLNNTSGDRVLVGQPGSGKTFLLHKFAKDGGGLFAVADDRTSLASAIRDAQPKAIIVDDAHIRNDLLLNLLQLRRALGISFDILTSSWPGGVESIRGILSLPDSQIHKLDLLTRDHIVEVIKNTGIGGPVELVRSIVDQAQGRPGLAVTLSYLCLQGDVRRVALGDALSSSIRTSFEPLVGKEATDVLAAFAMGGDSGMTMESVAKGLELTSIRVRAITAGLASGGVLRDIGRDRLSVIPAELRYPLVRDVFYSGPTSLNAEYFIVNSPDLGDTIFTLIGAKARGAIIPSSDLLDLLERIQPQSAWVAYAWMGPEESRTALSRHPEMLIELSHACLGNIPESIIPLLLSAATGDERPLNSTTDHPLRLIEDWIKSAWPGSKDVISRRALLLDAISKWLSGGGDAHVGLHALTFVFLPRFDRVTQDPGSGMSVTFSHGVVTPQDLKGIGDLWSKAFEIIRAYGESNWPHILTIIRNIAYPGPNVRIDPEEFYKIVKTIVTQMIKDVISLAHGHPAVLQKIKEIAENKGIEIEVPLDKYFEIFFPGERIEEDWETEHKRQMSAVEELSKELSSKDHALVIELIAKAEAEAKASGKSWPRMTPHLCGLLAKGVKQRIPWIRKAIEANLPSDLVVPFLREAVNAKEAEWESISIECLESPQYKYAPILIFLTMTSPPSDILDKVMHKLEGFDQTVEILCLRGEVPEDTRTLLLRHENDSVASKAALGIWQAMKDKAIGSLGEDWRKAILRLEENDYWLGEILAKDSALAQEWLMTNLFNERSVYRNFYDVCDKAIRSLDIEARRKILEALPDDFGHAEIAADLVGDDLSLYRLLLSKKVYSRIHLAPIKWEHEKPWSKEWVEKAKVALSAGYSPKDVADAIQGYSWSWTGKESAFWSAWVHRFSELCENNDPGIQEIGRAGSAYTKAYMERALEEERREEIYGR